MLHLPVSQSDWNAALVTNKLLLSIDVGLCHQILNLSHSQGTRELLGHLTSDCLEEDLAGSTEVVRATYWIGVHTLAQVGQILHCNHTTLLYRPVITFLTQLHSRSQLYCHGEISLKTSNVLVEFQPCSYIILLSYNVGKKVITNSTKPIDFLTHRNYIKCTDSEYSRHVSI